MTVRVALARQTCGLGVAPWTAQILPEASPALALRFTAVARAQERSGAGRLPVDEHLSVGLATHRAERLCPYADVLHEHRPCGRREAALRAAGAIRRFPGCAVAVVGCRDALVVVTGTGECGQVPWDGGCGWGPAVIGSLVHAWLAAGRVAADLLTVGLLQDAQTRGSVSIRPATRLVSSAPRDR